MEEIVKMKLKDLSKIDFESPEMKRKYEEIEKRSKERIEMAKPDWRNMHQTFDV